MRATFEALIIFVLLTVGVSIMFEVLLKLAAHLTLTLTPSPGPDPDHSPDPDPNPNPNPYPNYRCC